MPTILFISGKNWKLSLAELVSYLKAREIKFECPIFFERILCTFNFEKTSTFCYAGFRRNNKNWSRENKISNPNYKEAFVEKTSKPNHK
jgi:hypothetical protein